MLTSLVAFYKYMSKILQKLIKTVNIFRKDVAHDNIKSHKRKGLHLSLEDTFFEKPQGEGAN